MFDLRIPTDPAWLDVVFADFDRFLLDHAACERKASAMGMSFVVRYPDRMAILEPLIVFAREELDHFHQVFRLCRERGLTPRPDEKDPYVSALVSWVRTGRDERLLDRLLVAGVVEARGCERFALLAAGLDQRGWEPGLVDFYTAITRAEARHHGLFLRLARMCFAEATVAGRLSEVLAFEAELARGLPLRAALH